MTLATRLLAASGGSGAFTPDPVAIVRRILSSIPNSIAYRYHTTDDLGHDLGFFRCIDDGAGGYVACYDWSDTASPPNWFVDVGTSPDLLNWTFAHELEPHAHSGTIDRRPDGTFVVAYEKDLQTYSLGGNYVVVRVYSNLANLLAGTYSTSVNIPRTLATTNNAEGTPTFYSTDEPMVIGFHYNTGTADREAQGTLTSLTSWSASDSAALNTALDGLGDQSHGRLAYVTLHGVTLTFAEIDPYPVDWYLWQIAYWDGSGAVIQTITTHGGSTSQAVPSVSIVKNPSGPGNVLFCNIWLFATGGAAGEPGCAIWYRGIS